MTTSTHRPAAQPDTQAARATDAHWFKVGLDDAFNGRPEHHRGQWFPTYHEGYRQGRDELAAAHPDAGVCRADDNEPTTDNEQCVYTGCPAPDLIVCPCGDTVCSEHADRDHIHYCADYSAWVRS
jgi:hypothetical protein